MTMRTLRPIAAVLLFALAALFVAVLAGCTESPPGLAGDAFESHTGGTTGLPPDVPADVPADLPAPDRLDVPPPAPDLDPCGAVDILFVIDNSGSMSDDQETIALAAPAFVEDIEALGAGVKRGLHVGVVSTDTYNSNPDGCTSQGALVTVGEECPDYPPPDDPNTLTEREICQCGPYAEGNTYMTEWDDFSVSLPCAMNLGPGGGAETPADATFAALDGWLNSPGQCNEGFHRLGWTNGDVWVDRAALVLVFITDEDDSSGATPDVWVDHLRWLRGGDLNDVFFIGIAGGPCAFSNPARLQEFADLMPYSHVTSICAEDFGPVFDSALPTIAQGCQWDPPIPEG